MTVLPMLTQFLDETKVPLFYGDFVTLAKEADITIKMEDLDEMIFGAYKRVNRLDDIPIGMDLPEIVIRPESDLSHCLPESVSELMPKYGGYFTAWKYGNVLEHGGRCKPVMFREELEERAERGVRKLHEFAVTLDFTKKLDALRDLDEFHQNVIVPLYGKHLVRNKYPEPGK